MSTQTIDTAATANLGRRPGESPRQQSVCVEIPVTVHGSRLSPSANPNATLSGKTFVEETRTMIVFPQGAVLRLTESVAEGQILILKNPRVKQEVACRVVNSKTNAAAKGYVEVEFFQPTAGFWGITFPTGSGGAADLTPVLEESVRQPQAAPAAPPRAVYSRPSVAPPPAPVSAPISQETPLAEHVPNQTLELNRAIVAAYTNGQVPSPKSAPVAESVPAVEAAAPPVAVQPHAAEPKTNGFPTSAKPFRTEKPKTDAKPQGASKDSFMSSTPIVTADSIGHPETEFAGYSGPRASVKRGLSPVVAAPVVVEPKKAEASSESKSPELSFGRQLDSYQETESDTRAERSGRTWILVGVAAAVVILAGSGTYWWRHAKSTAASVRPWPLSLRPRLQMFRPARTRSNRRHPRRIRSPRKMAGNNRSLPRAAKEMAPSPPTPPVTTAALLKINLPGPLQANGAQPFCLPARSLLLLRPQTVDQRQALNQRPM